MQRYLDAKNEREGRAALLSSWVVIFFQFGLFLLIGASLYVYYSIHHLPAPQPADSIYPRFVWNQLPPGVAGLVIAAILAAGMSNLSAALNALASTTILDVLKPMLPGNRSVSDARLFHAARWTTVGWAVILVAIGLLARHWGSVLEAGLTIASILYGSLLGVFLLGLLTKRVQQTSAMIAMIAGLILMISIRLGTHIAFTWYVAIGTVGTFAVGWLASLALRESPR